MKSSTIILVALSVVIVIACNSRQEKQSNWSNSKYASQYDSVYTYIQSNWTQYLKEGSMDTLFPALPNPGISYLDDLLTQFYWDSFFNNEGLLLEETNHYIAKYHVDNLLFEADTLGFVPNMNATWAQSRSQPPYLSMMVRSYYEKSGSKDVAWLKNAYRILMKEYGFWMDTSPSKLETHLTEGIPSLVRYFHHGDTADLLGIYDHMVSRLHYPADAPLSQKLIDAVPFIVEAGTGMDFTPRFEGRCSDFLAVDLNANLYLYEKNFAWMVSLLGLKDQPNWISLAEQRKEMINRYLWNEERGLYLDYDFVNKRSGKVAAATTFSPLYAGLASPEQAKRVLQNLHLFEHDFGLSVVDMNTKEELNYMWGNDDLWAPMQYLAIAGLRNYGFDDDAKRIAIKWMDLITKNYIDPIPAVALNNGDTSYIRSPGRTYEKYNLKNGGSINDDEYPSLEILCWSSAIYCYAYDYVKSGNR